MGDTLTPSYVSDVRRSDLGPTLMLDAGYPTAPMIALMRRIVVEELERAGVTDADVVPWPPNWEPSQQAW